MLKIFLIIVLGLTGLTLFSQEQKIKCRKLTYNDFVSNYSTNDTSAVIIDIFFDKKNNGAMGEMSFLPITVGLAILPPTRLIGIGVSLISFPLFMHGGYTLIKYRKKKLYKVLTQYNKDRTLPKWVRKKANKLLNYYDEMPMQY